MAKSWLTGLLALVCVGVFVVRAERTLQASSQTFDEAVHVVAGYSYWKTGDFRINKETPPLPKLLWAIPLLFDNVPFEPDADQWAKNDIWRVGDAFLYETPGAYSERLFPARRVNIGFGVMLLLLLGVIAYRRWGCGACVLAMAFAACDPNLVAHSVILSTDMALTVCCVATWFMLSEYAQRPTPGRLWWAGLCMGGAFASKFSAGFAVVGIIVGVGYWLWRKERLALPKMPLTTHRGSAALTFLIRFGLIAALVIALSYFGYKALDWPRGLKQQLVRHEVAPGRFFFFGMIDSKTGLGYFPMAVLLKTPVVTLALAVVGCWPFGRTRWLKADVAFLVVPATVFFVGMMVSGVGLGLRIILPCYPLLILAVAKSSTLLAGPGRWWWRGLLVVGLGFTVWADRHHLAQPLTFFSEGVGRDHGHDYLGDSNLDWGQGLPALRDFLGEYDHPVIYLSYAGTARPEAYGIRYERLPTWSQFHVPPPSRVDFTGRVFVAVGVTNLQGIYLADPNTYAWLRDRPPLTRLDGSIWVWDITDDVDARQRCQQLAQRLR